MQDYIVVLACDLAEGGSALGPDSKAHCLAAVRLFQELVEQGSEPVVISSAGFASEDKYPAQEQTIGRMMVGYMSESGIPDSNFSVGGPVWSSRSEIEGAVRIVSEEDVSQACIFVVSSWYHIPRLVFITKTVENDNVTAEIEWGFRASSGRFVNALWEIGKLPAEVLLFLFKYVVRSVIKG